MIVFYIDTHCHLNIPPFQENLQQIVDRALESGVKQIVVPGIDLKSSEKALELSSKFDMIFAAVGIHPSEVNNYSASQFNQLSQLIQQEKTVAVGEIGLDFYHHPEEKKSQLDVLQMMFDLSSSNQKPVILHSRDSLVFLLELVSSWAKQQSGRINGFLGVFHGFEGDFSSAIKVKAMKMMIGIGGPVTYKNARIKQELVRKNGLENLVLETDSPFLSPHPFRGQVNEPYRIPVISQKIADLLELPVEKIAQETTRNAQNLFRLDNLT